MNIEGMNIWTEVTGSSAPEERIFYWRTSQQLALRKGDWKLVHNGATPDEGSNELFNIQKDSCEKRNIAQENQSRCDELHKELAHQYSMD